MNSSLVLIFTLLILGPSPAQAQDALAEMARHAKELIAAGRPGEAVPIYRELVRALPDNPGLVLNLGLALDMSGDKRAAIRQYQTVLKSDPQSFPALLLLGTAYLDLSQPALATSPLEKALKIQPDDFDAQANLAEANLTLERFATAATQFARLSERNPSSPKAWYGLGTSYDGLAQQSFDALAEAAPNSPYWLYLVAESRLATKQNYSAFYFFKRALAQGPPLRGIHAAIADIYKQTDHADWAAVEEAKEKQLPPPDCAVEKLECEYRAGDLLAITRETGKDAKTLYWKTRAYNQLAYHAYDTLGQLPASLEAHELRAKIEAKRRQYAQAAIEWRAALALAPGNPTVRRELATALAQSGSLDEAQTLFQELLRQDPASPSLNYFLGDVMRNAQKPRDAIPYLQKAATAQPNYLPAQSSLGLAYMQIGDPAQAIPHLRAALPVDQDGSLHYQLSRAYQAHGERELAGQMLKTYQELQKKNQESNKAVEKEVAITAPE